MTFEIERDASQLLVSVIDNSHGCSNDERPAPNSFGRLGIRERAVLLGGDLRIRTGPGHGFALFVSLPLAVVERRG